MKRLIPLLERLPQKKLPTILQCLGYFLWKAQLERDRRKWRELAAETVEDIVQIWELAYIPYIALRNVMRKFFDSKNSIVKRYVFIILNFYLIFEVISDHD